MNNIDQKTLQTNLRKASIRRNVRTASLVGAAASGALIGGYWLAASGIASVLYLLIERSIKKNL